MPLFPYHLEPIKQLGALEPLAEEFLGKLEPTQA